MIRFAELNSWLVYHPLNSIGSQKGYPDLTMCRVRGENLRVIFAELKRSRKEKLKPAQVVWRDALLAAGQEWHLWFPERWTEIESILSA